MLFSLVKQTQIIKNVVILITLATLAATAHSKDDRSDWYPSVFGADDEIGALNRLTPDTVLSAVKLVKTGKVYDLGIEIAKSFLHLGIVVFSFTMSSHTRPVVLLWAQISLHSTMN